MKSFIIGIILVFVLILVSSCGSKVNQEEGELEISSSYGVFLGLEGSEAVAASENVDLAVVDAQYLSAEEILEMQDRGQEVYSYLNIGSLETFRSYYEEYEHLTLRPYSNWEEEEWVDVTNKDWQNFIKDTLVEELLEKGIDGFWVDNVDVYGQYPNKETYVGIESILKNLMSYDKPVILNSGNEFVELYYRKNHQVDDILTGVNQETVFSSIDFNNQTFRSQTSKEQTYFLEYLDTLDKLNKDIYLLEYTTDKKLIKKIKTYARTKDWSVYISNSIELIGSYSQ